MPMLDALFCIRPALENTESSPHFATALARHTRPRLLSVADRYEYVDGSRLRGEGVDRAAETLRGGRIRAGFPGLGRMHSMCRHKYKYKYKSMALDGKYRCGCAALLCCAAYSCALPPSVSGAAGGYSPMEQVRACKAGVRVSNQVGAQGSPHHATAQRWGVPSSLPYCVGGSRRHVEGWLPAACGHAVCGHGDSSRQCTV